MEVIGIVVAQPGTGRKAATRDGDGRSSSLGPERLARGLGWASLGLGAATIAAPGQVARAIGVEDSKRLVLRGAVGAREIAAGVGILSRRRPVGWLWARIAGDAFDLGMLGIAFAANARHTERRRRVALTAAAVAGITAADVIASVRLTRSPGSSTQDRTRRASAATTIRLPAQDCYAFWRDFENLPRFMAHLQSVDVLGGGRSRWTAKAPAGVVEWEAEIVGDTVDELIAWRSVEGSDVRNAGSVRFSPAPGGQGTEVAVELEYVPPAGKLGANVAKLFGEEPTQQIRDDLRRFKQVMETGEVVRSDASAGGTSARVQLKQRPAQPLSA